MISTAFGKTFREDVLQFPPVNIIEKAAAYELEIAAPGFDKADFNVKLEGNMLSISTEKTNEKTETEHKW
jgi:HSP20 family protein